MRVTTWSVAVLVNLMDNDAWSEMHINFAAQAIAASQRHSLWYQEIEGAMGFLLFNRLFICLLKTDRTGYLRFPVW